MNGGIDVTIKPPFRDLRGRFVKADQQLLEDKREMMRNLGRSWVEIARDEAPERTGAFKRSIIYRTFVQGQNVSLQSYSAQPLGKWIVEGTPPHVIRAGGRALSFMWPKGPRGPGRYHFKSVNHPGTQANPYPQRAYDRWKPGASESLRRITRNYVAVLKGGQV